MNKFLFLVTLCIALIIPNRVDAKKKKYPNGDYYEGEWKKGAPNGLGIMKYSDGNTYTGEWQFGEITGNGRMSYKNGEQYEGQWNLGKPHGYGIMKYHNGDTYTGDWENGTYQGNGNLKFKNGDYNEGNWISGILTRGTIIKKSGEKFIGELDYGNYKNGELTLSEDQWLKGEWKDGAFYNGICDSKIGDNYYKGEWKDGIFVTGICKCTFNDDNIKHFDGEIFADGSMKGKAEYTYDAEYNGELKSYKRHGMGTMHYSLNDINHSSHWSEDELLNGRGSFIQNNTVINFDITKIDSTASSYRINIYKNGQLYETGTACKDSIDTELPSTLINLHNQRSIKERTDFYDKNLNKVILTGSILLSELMPPITLLTRQAKNVSVEVFIGFYSADKLKFGRRSKLLDGIDISNGTDRAYLAMYTNGLGINLTEFEYTISDGVIVFGDGKFRINLKELTLKNEYEAIKLKREKY